MSNKDYTTWIVQAYNYGSEHTYTFGPFRGDDSLERFLNKMDESKWDTPFYSVLNDPKLLDTGKELSI